MAKKKTEARKPKPAANSKTKSPRKGLAKRPRSQTPEAKSGGRHVANKDDTGSTQLAPETDDLSSAIMLSVSEPKPASMHVVDREIEGGVAADADVNARRGAVAATDPRLPQIPTTLVRRNRHGVVQCECTAGPDGIFYNGRKYRSLSGAASAASKDLGLNPVVNGYVFFHLAKPGRARLGEVERLRRLGNRYEEKLAALLMAQPGETLNVGVKDEVEGHARRVQQILSVVAE